MCLWTECIWKEWHMTLLQWSENGLRCLLSVNEELLIEIVSLAGYFIVKRSNIQHRDICLRFFTAGTARKSKMLSQLYAFFVYLDLARGWHKTKAYGKEVVLITTRTFWRWTDDQAESVAENVLSEYRLRIVPVLFCTMLYKFIARTFSVTILRQLNN